MEQTGVPPLITVWLPDKLATVILSLYTKIILFYQDTGEMPFSLLWLSKSSTIFTVIRDITWKVCVINTDHPK